MKRKAPLNRFAEFAGGKVACAGRIHAQGVAGFITLGHRLT